MVDGAEKRHSARVELFDQDRDLRVIHVFAAELLRDLFRRRRRGEIENVNLKFPASNPC